VACSSLVALAGDGEVWRRRAIRNVDLLLALEPAVEEGTGEEWKSPLPRAREGRDGEEGRRPGGERGGHQQPT
jgi:hypothetical protein